jgi:hypothetical protein
MLNTWKNTFEYSNTYFFINEIRHSTQCCLPDICDLPSPALCIHTMCHCWSRPRCLLLSMPIKAKHILGFLQTADRFRVDPDDEHRRYGDLGSHGLQLVHICIESRRKGQKLYATQMDRNCSGFDSCCCCCLQCPGTRYVFLSRGRGQLYVRWRQSERNSLCIDRCGRESDLVLPYSQLAPPPVFVGVS